MVVPFAPTPQWYSKYVAALLSGLPEEEAVAKANSSYNDLKGMARCVIAGNGAPQALSIPVAGGSSRLKKKNGCEEIQISEHGRWRDVHKGAIAAAYGKTAFYPCIAEILESIYNDRASTRLADFDIRLFREMNRFLGIPEILDVIKENGNKDVLSDTVSEIKKKVNSELSILDAVFRLGKDTLFCLL